MKRSTVLAPGLLVLAMVLPVSSSSAQSGVWFLKIRHSGKCLHQQGARYEDDARISQWSCVNQPNVKLRKIPVDGTYFLLQFVHSEKCVHVHGGYPTPRDTPVTQWTCPRDVRSGGADHFLWREEPVSTGYIFLISRAGDPQAKKENIPGEQKYGGPPVCLHQRGATHKDGDAITTWDCVDIPNVHWKFEPA